MPTFKSIYTKLVYDSVQEYLKTGFTKDIENEEIPDILKKKRPCFVTFKSKKGKLRGCIGTIKPRYVNLYTEIIRNAISAATQDNRFSKIKLSELENMHISVEVLSKPEEIDDITLLNPKIYGLIIMDEYRRRGVLLPDIADIDTIEKQINIVKKKAGISQDTKTGLKYYRFKTEKFY